MRKRILIGMKLLLKENPVLPVGFKFNGEDLIDKFKREEREYVNNTFTEMGLQAEEHTVMTESVMSPK